MADTIGKRNPFRYRSYFYDIETGLYFLKTRYYDPEIGRFLSMDSIDYADTESINGLNMYAYCLNNPVMYVDENGNLPNWAKWLIGGVAFIGAIALTIATGGAVAPLIYGMIASIAIGGLFDGITEALNGGNFYDGFIDGASDGAMFGGIFALGSSIFRVASIAKQGITIGKTGTYEQIAEMTKTYHYQGLKSHGFLVKHFGREFADKVGWVQNKTLINCVKFFRGAIYDTGGELTGAYAKEVLLTKGYKYLYNVWLF